MMDIDDSIDEAMQMAVSILWDLEGGLEDSTIRWRDRHEGLLICEISDDDAIAHFRFRKTPRAVGYALAKASSIPTRCYKSVSGCV